MSNSTQLKLMITVEVDMLFYIIGSSCPYVGFDAGFYLESKLFSSTSKAFG